MLRPSLVYGVGAQFAEVWVEEALSRPQSHERFIDAVELQLVHVRDVVDALLLAQMQATATNEVFNIAGNEVATMAQIEGSYARSHIVSGQTWLPRLRMKTGCLTCRPTKV